VKLLVSFIIPVVNGEKDIRCCLTSIRDQNFAPQGYEVLVVDNGSTDRTPQVIRELGYDLEIIPGITVAGLRNHGVRLARGDCLAFVDSDVSLSSDWLQQRLSVLSDKAVVAIGGPRCIPEQAT
jgi:glycosyltransferase involved in cell wall biosynthesis